MFFDNKDHYRMLGIPPDATDKEIQEQYKKLMIKNHPDRFRGLKAKHESAGDDVLLEIIEEKIRQAEEVCKLINEAREVLSDPVQRKAYDEERHEQEVFAPEIVVSPKRIDFGSLTEGEKKSASFTIENKGGLATVVEINWENEPDWGEIIIEPDPGNTFPIKVTVSTNIKGIPSGRKEQKIQINVDGTTFAVEVSLVVVSAKAIDPAGARAAPPRPPIGGISPPTPIRLTRGLKVLVIITGVVIIAILGDFLLTDSLITREKKAILDNFPVEITEARRIKCGEEYEGEDWEIAERRGFLDVICVVFSIRNLWTFDAKIRIPENTPIHGDFYNVFLDPGATYPCEVGDVASFESGEKVTYSCFEQEGFTIETLCLDVGLKGSENTWNYDYLNKTVCSDVVSIR